jgi:hypothetical protein
VSHQHSALKAFLIVDETECSGLNCVPPLQPKKDSYFEVSTFNMTVVGDKVFMETVNVKCGDQREP